MIRRHGPSRLPVTALGLAALLLPALGPVPAAGQAADERAEADRRGAEVDRVRTPVGTRGADRPGPADHVVLVSVDGLRPEFYLDERWPAPNLQEMRREGAHAERVRSVFPSATYPGHATMITGALPVRHGILYNGPFQPEGQTGLRYWHADSLRVPALWDAVDEAGGRTASVGWPVSVGAPVDWNVPEIWSPDGDGDPIALIREHATPPGLLAEIEEEATGPLTADNFTVAHLVRDDLAGAAAAHLLERHRPRLLFLHLIHTDRRQHAEGREGDGVRRAVAVADRAVGRIREAAARAGMLERTAIVVAGDHGFVDVDTLVAPNAWLAEAGLRARDRSRGAWRATFFAGGGAAFLHVRGPDDAQTVAAVRRVLAELPPDVRRHFRVVEREEMDRLGVDPRVRLALAARPGVAFLSSAEGEPVRDGSGGTHGHLPDADGMATGLVAWGAGVRPGAVVPDMGLEDVAPLVAALLGIDFEAPDGELRPELLAERAKPRRR